MGGLSAGSLGCAPSAEIRRDRDVTAKKSNVGDSPDRLQTEGQDPMGPVHDEMLAGTESNGRDSPAGQNVKYILGNYIVHYLLDTFSFSPYHGLIQ